MGRNLSKPRDTSITERSSGVEAVGNSTCSERPMLLGQQFEHPLLRRYQRIQSCRLTVEVLGDDSLLWERWNWQPYRTNFGFRYPEPRYAVRRQLKLNPHRLCLKAAEQKGPVHFVLEGAKKSKVIAAYKIAGSLSHESRYADIIP